MKKLSTKEYWDSKYKPRLLENTQPYQKINPIKILIKRLFGERLLRYMPEYMLRSYADYILWDVIYKKYMPKTKGLKVLEIGSAPGSNLIRLNQKNSFIPYGIEYSESGVELNRKLFSLHGINPDNVIWADFLSDEFHNKYKGCFDIVISRGFIEHFNDVEDIIQKHINLLTCGGYLFVSMPNFRGVNYILACIFHREFLSMHNINIMRKREFCEIFNQKGLSALLCDYYGTFNFGLFNTPYKNKSSLIVRLALSLCNNLQLILNVVFRILFKDRGLESRLFSPYLIYVGVKKEGKK